MDIAALVYAIISAVFTIMLGVVGYFLKRTLGLVDRLEQELKRIEESKLSVTRFAEFQQETNKRFEKLTQDAEDAWREFLTREDFLREQAKTERKLEQIYNLLIERRSVCIC